MVVGMKDVKTLELSLETVFFADIFRDVRQEK